MDDVGELAVRMGAALALVLGVVAVSYGVARRRQARRSSPSRFNAFRRRSQPVGPTLEVEARTGLARGAAAVAVRFADRIVLIGVTDGAASTVLADIPADEWDRVPDEEDDDAPVPVSTTVRTPLDPNGIVSERPSFLEALRDATSRRP